MNDSMLHRFYRVSTMASPYAPVNPSHSRKLRGSNVIVAVSSSS